MNKRFWTQGLAAVSILIVIFLVLSFTDVNAHNLTDHKYASWNILATAIESVEVEEEETEIHSYEEAIHPYRYVGIEIVKAEEKTDNEQTEEVVEETEEPVEEVKTETKKEKKKETVEISDEEVMELARLLMAENGNSEEDEAIVLTGVVVLKRVKSDKFPNSVMDVISAKGQYACYSSGSYWNEPNERCIKIAKKLLTTDLADEYPDELVFQSEFRQGVDTYKAIGNQYFCLMKGE